MTAIDDTPTNLNYLTPLNFKFAIKRAPHVEFFIQKISIPSIVLVEVDAPSPLVKIPYPGDHINYGNLEITFKVDEKLQNYLEIHNWLRALGKPTSTDEYAAIEANPSWTGKGIYSDITLSILSNIKTINYDVTFVDAFPIGVSSVTFNTTDEDVQYVEASATFKYSYYNISQSV